jgi:hypothetical protein
MAITYALKFLKPNLQYLNLHTLNQSKLVKDNSICLLKLFKLYFD